MQWAFFNVQSVAYVLHAHVCFQGAVALFLQSWVVQDVFGVNGAVMPAMVEVAEFQIFRYRGSKFDFAAVHIPTSV
jgi:hypothetical protein